MHLYYFALLNKTMKRVAFFLLSFFLSQWSSGQSKALVFQSDFGLKDGAVAAMKGVAYSLSHDLMMFDLTHEIPAYNIWEAAYRLDQSASYWPAGTVFVSVVDPGVGSARRSVVMKSKTGHLFVTPDNGTLTLVAETLGVDEVRVIDEARHRLKNSNESYTFHGRDVYAYTGAKLAAGIITFEQVGDTLLKDVVRIQYKKPAVVNNILEGAIDILDVQYGNVWTNITKALVDQAGIKAGSMLHIRIYQKDRLAYEGDATFARTFSEAPPGKTVAYLNSLLKFSLAINQGNFASKFKIGSGAEWRITVSRK
jgi:S-adenosylmethionine hydrolase